MSVTKSKMAKLLDVVFGWLMQGCDWALTDPLKAMKTQPLLKPPRVSNSVRIW